jgi:hypothetical protein
MGYIIDPGSALRLLIDSEKRGGHVYLKHIGISNDELLKRLLGSEGRHGKIHWISAFLSSQDAASAVSQALKNSPTDDNSNVTSGKRGDAAWNAETDVGFRVRFAFGGGVQTFVTKKMRIVIRANSLPPRFYIHTFFPLPPLEFDKTIKPGS